MRGHSEPCNGHRKRRELHWKESSVFNKSTGLFVGRKHRVGPQLTTMSFLLVHIHKYLQVRNDFYETGPEGPELEDD